MSRQDFLATHSATHGTCMSQEHIEEEFKPDVEKYKSSREQTPPGWAFPDLHCKAAKGEICMMFNRTSRVANSFDSEGNLVTRDVPIYTVVVCPYSADGSQPVRSAPEFPKGVSNLPWVPTGIMMGMRVNSRTGVTVGELERGTGGTNQQGALHGSSLVATASVRVVVVRGAAARAGASNC